MILCFLILILETVTVLAQTEAEIGTDESTCLDKKTRVIINGKKKMFCRWVSKDKDTRCNEVHKQVKTKISKKTGLEVQKVKRFNPKKLCTCTCPVSQDLDADDKICPNQIEEAQAYLSPFASESVYGKIEDEEGAVESAYGGGIAHAVTYQLKERGSCIEEGFKKGQTCSYEYRWRGCTYQNLKCEPKIVCECAAEFLSQGDEWSCKIITYQQCPARPRPPPVGTAPPYEVPEESDAVCVPGDPTPKDPDTGDLVEEEDEIDEEENEIDEEEEEVDEEEVVEEEEVVNEEGVVEEEDVVDEEDVQEELEIRRRLRY